ncbi:MAG: response regulator transcription factor [Bryobacteraceae bacterium]
MIRVVIVEDQTIVRRGIVSLLDLTPDIRIVGEAVNGEEAPIEIESKRPDVVIMDIRLPKRSGIDVLRGMQGKADAPPVILLTTFDDDLLFLQGMRAGARGFLLKDVSEERLAEVIRIVASGGSLLQPAITESVSRTVREMKPAFESAADPEPLTPYERHTLRLVAGGLSNREIAESAGSTEGAVKNQLSSVLAKLGVRDRTRAVLRGIERGLI